MRTLFRSSLFPDNNLTILRLLCACAVLYGHAFAISSTPTHLLGGRDISVWLSRGVTWSGQAAVVIFFSLSGILVTKSAIYSSNAAHFIFKRIARIFPALILCCFLVAFVMAPIVGQGPLSISVLIRYFIWNSTSIYNQHIVKNVFSLNPQHSLNGSLWSLTLEFRLYFIIFLSLLISRNKKKMILLVTNLIFLGWVIFLPMKCPLIGSSMELLGTKDFPFYAMIFLISSTLVLLGLEECNYLPIIFFAGLFFYVSKNPTDDPWAFWLFLIFVSLQLAKLKLPTKLIPKRDLSYGLYLYGFPTEQCLIRYLPDMGPYRLFVISLCFCLLLASASWRFVEKYAIQYARSRPIFS